MLSSMTTGLYSPKVNKAAKVLRNVTNMSENRQLSEFTCFIIHVGLECIGVEAYA